MQSCWISVPEDPPKHHLAYWEMQLSSALVIESKLRVCERTGLSSIDYRCPPVVDLYAWSPFRANNLEMHFRGDQPLSNPGCWKLLDRRVVQ